MPKSIIGYNDFLYRLDTALNTIQDTVASGAGTSFKNRVVNGSLKVAQRTVGYPAAPLDVPSTGIWVADRWYAVQTRSESPGALKAYHDNRETAVYSFVDLYTQQNLSPAAASSVAFFRTKLYNLWDFHWKRKFFQYPAEYPGKNACLSFRMLATVPNQLYSGSIQIKTADNYYYSYVFTYTVPQTMNYLQKLYPLIEIPIPPPPNNIVQDPILMDVQELTINFDLGSGSNHRTSTINSWVQGRYLGAVGAVGVMDQGQGTMRIQQIQLELGDSATSFEERPYSVELDMCRYYYEKLNRQLPSSTQSFIFYTIPFTQKRKIPTLVTGTVVNNAGVQATTDSYTFTDQDLRVSVVNNAFGGDFRGTFTGAVDAEDSIELQ